MWPDPCPYRGSLRRWTRTSARITRSERSTTGSRRGDGWSSRGRRNCWVGICLRRLRACSTSAGGPGAYATWLADLGYDVHLVDPVPLHVEQAAAAARVAPSVHRCAGRCPQPGRRRTQLRRRVAARPAVSPDQGRGAARSARRGPSCSRPRRCRRRRRDLEVRIDRRRSRTRASPAPAVSDDRRGRPALRRASKPDGYPGSFHDVVLPSSRRARKTR
jgi:hypothetical protein